jgi:hypothetical protein
LEVVVSHHDHFHAEKVVKSGWEDWVMPDEPMSLEKATRGCAHLHLHCHVSLPRVDAGYVIDPEEQGM